MLILLYKKNKRCTIHTKQTARVELTSYLNIEISLWLSLMTSEVCIII